MYEIKITFSDVSLLIIYYMIYKTNQSFEFGCCQLQFLDDKFSISRIYTLENCTSRILGELKFWKKVLEQRYLQMIAPIVVSV